MRKIFAGLILSLFTMACENHDAGHSGAEKRDQNYDNHSEFSEMHSEAGLEIPLEESLQDELIMSRSHQIVESFDLASSSLPLGASFRETSEFMLGQIHVSVVLFESNGEIDPNTENWTHSRINRVKSELKKGAEWWEEAFRRNHPQSNSAYPVKFHFDWQYADAPVSTPYEPISRGLDDQELWIDSFLNLVGYNKETSIFTDVRKWSHDQRVLHQTQWAFTVFIIDSTEDDDHVMKDKYFAYSYIGGPFMVMTTESSWPPEKLHQVFAHEIGHIFYALDEYPRSTSYSSFSGYFNTQNLNAADSHPKPGERVPSIMAEASLQDEAWPEYKLSPSSLRMVGWGDHNSNHVIDILETPPELSITDDGFDGEVFRFRSQSKILSLKNQNPKGTKASLTLNRLQALQAKENSGVWVDIDTLHPYFQATTKNELSISKDARSVEIRALTETPLVTSSLYKKEFEGRIPADPEPEEPTEPDAEEMDLLLIYIPPALNTLEYRFVERTKRCEDREGYVGRNQKLVAQCGRFEEREFTGKAALEMDFRALRASRTYFDGSRFDGSDFSYSLMDRASWKSVSCVKCNLTKVDFRNADLSGADLSRANLSGALYNSKTKLPFSSEEAKSRGMEKR